MMSGRKVNHNKTDTKMLDFSTLTSEDENNEGDD